MTDIDGDEMANKRIEQAGARAQEILTAPSEQLVPPSRRFADIVSDATRRAPLQSLMVAFLLGIVIARRRSSAVKTVGAGTEGVGRERVSWLKNPFDPDEVRIFASRSRSSSQRRCSYQFFLAKVGDIRFLTNVVRGTFEVAFGT